MNHFIKCFLSTITGTLLLPTCYADNFNIILKPKWYNLDVNYTKSNEFGGKWILAGKITFKKRSKHCIFLETLSFHWNGKTIDNLVASLYKKNLGDAFLPIEENLICDGVWNEAKQTLVLHFNERQNLGPRSVFYLVLTVPENIEPLLRSGSFSLEEQCLPRQFKQCTQREKLSLNLDEKQ